MRRHYRHDGLPGYAFRRAAEERATFWGALRQQITSGRYALSVLLVAAAFAAILFVASVLA